MKKFKILGIALAAIQVCTMHAQDYSTFLSPRSVSTNQQYTEYACKFAQDGFNVLVGGLYQQSFKNDRTPKLFTPNGLDTIEFDELGGGQVNPVWLDLHSASFEDAPYQSTVTFSMKQQAIGLPFMMRKNFDDFFIEIDSAFLSVKNDLSLTENRTSGTEGEVPSVYSSTIITNAAMALSNPDWEYGKMVGRPERKGLDNLQIRFGFNKELEDKSVSGVVSPYLVLLAPTGTGSTAEYIFEPIVGSNHFGLGAGVGGVLCNCDVNDVGTKFVYDIVYRYEFGAKEIRSFDLTANGPWSRYLLLALENLNEPADSFDFYGINELTRRAWVQPGHQGAINIRFEHKFENNCGLFVNYNLFARGQEQITNIEEGIGNFGIRDYTDELIISRTTCSRAKINEAVGSLLIPTGYTAVTQIPASDLGFVKIVTQDLDTQSAANQTYITSTFAGGFMYHGDLYFMQLGGSVAVAQTDAAMDQWTVWASAGIHF